MYLYDQLVDVAHRKRAHYLESKDSGLVRSNLLRNLQVAEGHQK